MFNCHCQDTTGRFIRMGPRKKLWICDLCKGCREIVVKQTIIYDVNLPYLLKLYHARMAKPVDARDLKSLG